jgi:hypothetical protein
LRVACKWPTGIMFRSHGREFPSTNHIIIQTTPMSTETDFARHERPVARKAAQVKSGLTSWMIGCGQSTIIGYTHVPMTAFTACFWLSCRRKLVVGKPEVLYLFFQHRENILMMYRNAEGSPIDACPSLAFSRTRPLRPLNQNDGLRVRMNYLFVRPATMRMRLQSLCAALINPKKNVSTPATAPRNGNFAKGCLACGVLSSTTPPIV